MGHIDWEGVISLILFVLLVIVFISWIRKVIKLSKNEDKSGMWIVLLCGLFLTPFIGWLVGSAYKEERKKNKNEEFWCGICQAKYREEFLGCETLKEGKICRYCLEKKNSERQLSTYFSERK